MIAEARARRASFRPDIEGFVAGQRWPWWGGVSDTAGVTTTSVAGITSTSVAAALARDIGAHVTLKPFAAVATAVSPACAQRQRRRGSDRDHTHSRHGASLFVVTPIYSSIESAPARLLTPTCGSHLEGWSWHLNSSIVIDRYQAGTVISMVRLRRLERQCDCVTRCRPSRRRARMSSWPCSWSTQARA